MTETYTTYDLIAHPYYSKELKQTVKAGNAHRTKAGDAARAAHRDLEAIPPHIDESEDPASQILERWGEAKPRLVAAQIELLRALEAKDDPGLRSEISQAHRRQAERLEKRTEERRAHVAKTLTAEGVHSLTVNDGVVRDPTANQLKREASSARTFAQEAVTGLSHPNERELIKWLRAQISRHFAHA